MQLWKDNNDRQNGPKIGDVVYWEKEKCLVKIISRETLFDGVHLTIEKNGKVFDIINPHFTRRKQNDNII